MEKQDKAFEKVNKILKLFGKRVPTRDDALKGLDDETAKRIVEFSKDVREAKKKIQDMTKMKLPRETEHVMNATLEVLEDSAMILQSHSKMKQLEQTIKSNIAQACVFYTRIQSKLQRVEAEIAKLAKQQAEIEQARLLETTRVKANTA